MFLTVALILSVAIATTVNAKNEEISKYKEECRKEYNIGSNIIKNRLPIPADKKCYYKCLAQKMALMDKAGELDVGAFKSKMKAINGPSKYVEKIDACSSKKTSDVCGTAEAVYKCLKAK